MSTANSSKATSTTDSTVLTDEQEPKNAAELMKAMKSIDKEDGGENIIKASIATFRAADGKEKKGDVYSNDLDNALQLLHGLVSEAVQKAESSGSKKKSAGAEKFKFEASLHKQFDKTLDDVFISFLRWAATSDENEGKSDNAASSMDQRYNVSKAFRRLEAYASWMEDAKADLTEPELTPDTIQVAWKNWGSSISYDSQGRLVWWFDLAAIDKKSVKKIDEIETLRLFVFLTHVVMFDESAQKNGMVIVENLAKYGFFSLMTLFPPSLGTKLDRLTIGSLPVKMKACYLTEEAVWIKVMMAIMAPFMSKKMRSRIVSIGSSYSKLSDVLGGSEYVLKGFAGGKVEGEITTDVSAKYFE